MKYSHRNHLGVIAAVLLASALLAAAEYDDDVTTPPPKYCSVDSAASTGDSVCTKSDTSPSPAPTAYRLVSITKWNATADMHLLHSAETNVSLDCGSATLAAITGFSLQRISDVMFGSHAKVLDFPSVEAYKSYQQCAAQHPARAATVDWEVWKSRAFYTYHASVEDATAGAYWACTIGNATNPTVLLDTFIQLTQELVSLLSSVQQNEYTLPGIVESPVDIAHVAAFAKPQGATAMLGYLNAASQEGLPPLDLFRTIATTMVGPRRILFAPIRLK